MLVIPNLEVPAVQHLASRQVRAGTSRPNPMPPVFTRVTQTGGRGRINLRQAEVTLLLEVFGTAGGHPDEDAADAEMGRVQTAMAGLDGTYMAGVWVYEARLTTPVNYPDAAAGLARYQSLATFLVAMTEGTP